MNAIEFLRIDSETAGQKGMQQLLVKASTVIRREPSLAQKLPDGTFKISAPMPAGYKPQMMRGASRIAARFSSTGWIFEISEVDEFSSGGWMASCIPTSMYRLFLQAWLAYADRPVQGELFA